jgi:predicted DNA-binding ArsR family transcriptional regulator
MKENLKENYNNEGKFSPEEIKLFNDLVEKYNLEQNLEEIIIKKGSREIHLLKREKMFIQGQGWVKIEDRIKQILNEE